MSTATTTETRHSNEDVNLLNDYDVVDKELDLNDQIASSPTTTASKIAETLSKNNLQATAQRRVEEAEIKRIEHNGKVLADLQPGDLIEFKRNLYSHWAVYIGNTKIVHLHGEKEGTPLTLSGVAILPEASRSAATVVISNFWDIVKDSYVYRNNSLDAEFHPLPPEHILLRAFKNVNDSNYNIFWYNCEHFAKNCRYGVESSEQTQKLLKLLKFGYQVTNGLRSLETGYKKLLPSKIKSD